MDFCKKCGSIMVAKEEKKRIFLACRSCDFTLKKYKPLEIEESVKKRPLETDIVIVEKNQEALPKTRAECPKCSHTEAVWWMQQTRSADEAPTLFLRCTKCRHSWREYG
ncbi:MAG: transcription factor S [Candidatus Aenigmarchaeota archaeon]|nr:transcription factor S [Candidatus Aenigmarchaeota archaeon]